jgi:NADH-quinone oxidoreductase subunit L
MEQLFPVQYSYLIPLLPIIGAMGAGFLGARWLKQQSHWPIWLGVGASAVISCLLLAQMLALWGQGQPVSAIRHWYTWISAGSFQADAGAFIDPLTAVMLVVVTGIGFLITVFSRGYMAGEEGYFRFFAYLGLFIFMMTILVMGNNLVMLYLGWEGVGLCSYLLIGYYYERPAAREAAKKAFLVNRIGDFGFGIGIMLTFLVFRTVSFFGDGVGTVTGILERVASPSFLQQLPEWKRNLVQWIPFCLMLGAFGKSAQFPLYVWLPDAMEGPTPVSALIHAATMVTAGVYMIVRCGTLFVGNELAMNTVAAVGAFTALLAATIALRQFDLKKVWAYSTISQLGYMFVGVAALAPVAGIFHLVTHAFFKALLFLASGVVMHAMLGELDLRKLSGLKRVLPWTRWMMLVGCLALAGFFPFSGFWSKDEIVAAAWHRNAFLGAMMLFTAFLTAYYSFRLYFRVFEGPLVVPSTPPQAHPKNHGPEDVHARASESAVEAHDTARSGVDVAPQLDAHQHAEHHNPEPMVMIVPLLVLAAGAVVAGFINFPERELTLGHFLRTSPSLLLTRQMADATYGSAQVLAPGFGAQVSGAREEEALSNFHRNMMIVSACISALGIYLAYVLHRQHRDWDERLVARFPRLNRLLEAKYWVDEVYQNGIVEPLRGLGRLCYGVDRIVIDTVVFTISLVPRLSGFSLKLTFQRGYLQGYALAMLLGVALILLLIFL